MDKQTGGAQLFSLHNGGKLMGRAICKVDLNSEAFRMRLTCRAPSMEQLIEEEWNSITILSKWLSSELDDQAGRDGQFPILRETRVVAHGASCEEPEEQIANDTSGRAPFI